MKKLLLTLFLTTATIGTIFLATKNAEAVQPTNCVGDACNDLDQGSELLPSYGQGNYAWFFTFQNNHPKRTIRITYRQLATFNTCMSESTLDIQPGRKVAIISFCSPMKANYIN